MPMLPLVEAAARAGVTPEALRKRIQRGTVVGRKRQGQWYVAFDDAPAVQQDDIRTASGAGGQAAGRPSGYQEEWTSGRVEADTAGQASGQQDESGQASLQSLARAQEMAAYTERLLEPWRRRVEELAGENGQLRADLRHAKEELAQREATAEEVGRLKAQLEQAQRRVAEFEAVTDELEREQDAAAAEAARRPWWQFWRRETVVPDCLGGAAAESS
jgi:hypothetical protein